MPAEGQGQGGRGRENTHFGMQGSSKLAYFDVDESDPFTGMGR